MQTHMPTKSKQMSQRGKVLSREVTGRWGRLEKYWWQRGRVESVFVGRCVWGMTNPRNVPIYSFKIELDKFPKWITCCDYLR